MLVYTFAPDKMFFMSIFKKLFNKADSNQVKNKFYSFPVSNIIRETEHAVTLVFDKPNENFEFNPGQYLTLKLKIHENELHRAYSLCNLPDENTLQVTVKETDDGYFSKYVNNELEIGDLVDVFPPRGKFTFLPNENQKRHIVCFAGGSGITPIASIIQSVLQNEPNSKATLFYGNRTQNDIIFKNKLKRLETESDQFEVIHILSEEQGTDFTDYYGYIDSDKVNLFANKYFHLEEELLFYLCGPEKMTTAIKKSLITLGYDKKLIKTELFTTSLPNENGQSIKQIEINSEIVLGATIKAKYSGEQHKLIYVDERKSVLDTALDSGMKIPFSCLNGVCSTCSARLVKGTVVMEQNFALEDEEVQDGFILTCQSRPTSDKIEVDWDDNRI